MQNSAIPWILTIMLALYIFGVQYYAEHRPLPDPSIEFYDTTTVTIDIIQPETDQEEEADILSIYGQFNNILEGRRQLVKAKETPRKGRVLLKFLVNSPRPAYLFANNNRFEVFLVPGDSSLHISVFRDSTFAPIDSVNFKGKTADICTYYQSKAEQFGQTHLRSTRHVVATEAYAAYTHMLDSMSAQELSFLAEKEAFTSLPNWFAMFEKNEILYQRAYLKLADAYNREIPEELLDKVPLNNPRAMFSYYYYLYLNTYLAREAGLPQPETQNLVYMRDHVKRARAALKDGPWDVFLTRLIFQYINQDNKPFAKELFNQYKKTFSKNKYERFLEKKLKDQ